MELLILALLILIGIPALILGIARAASRLFRRPDSGG